MKWVEKFLCLVAKKTTSKTVLHLLASKINCRKVLVEVINNPNITPKVLFDLCQNKDWNVRYEVAKKATLAQRQILNFETCPLVKHLLPQNQSLIKEILFKLAKDKEEIVRRVAEHALTLRNEYIIFEGTNEECLF